MLELDGKPVAAKLVVRVVETAAAANTIIIMESITFFDPYHDDKVHDNAESIVNRKR